MPELPDVLAYLTGLERLLGGRTLGSIQLRSPFLVRTFEPQLETAVGRRLVGFRRIGKRIAWKLEGDLFLVIHPMIAGRFHWKKAGTKPSRKIDLAAFHFDDGAMLLTEAGSKKRASLHVVAGAAGLAAHDPGGLEVLDASLADFTAVLMRHNHTLKRALTDPRLFSGIGNAYSDEILHAAQLSPVKWTTRLTTEEITGLYEATRSTLADWCARMQAEAHVAFPEKVSAFRPEMAVHGRCGKVLADRQLSRMLKNDWPKTIEALEVRLGPLDKGAP